MTQPLALVSYERLLPGTQLVNRLQDLGYRVLTSPGGSALAAVAHQEKPMIVLIDLVANHAKATQAIADLRHSAATNHLPIIAYSDDKNPTLTAAAREAGATLVVSEVAILTHLEQFLERALELD